MTNKKLKAEEIKAGDLVLLWVSTLDDGKADGYQYLYIDSVENDEKHLDCVCLRSVVKGMIYRVEKDVLFDLIRVDISRIKEDLLNPSNLVDANNSPSEAYYSVWNKYAETGLDINYARQIAIDIVRGWEKEMPKTKKAFLSIDEHLASSLTPEAKILEVIDLVPLQHIKNNALILLHDLMKEGLKETEIKDYLKNLIEEL